ncbi:MAG TPA: hypothetical protein VIL30_12140 [Ramlibacter sp.]|jgi:hypothetical protein
MKIRLLGLALAACCSLVACGGGNDADSQPEQTTFVFRMHGMSASEEFRATTASPEVTAQARAQLFLPVAERRMFANGKILAGDGGENPGWNWHFDGFELAEMSIELCDARPSMVEADLAYWLQTVKQFCPWGSYVYAELPAR